MPDKTYFGLVGLEVLTHTHLLLSGIATLI